MNKTSMGQLAREVAAETGLPEARVQLVLKTFLWRIMDHLADDERVTLTGFGSFHPKIVAPRRVRNPQTGAVQHIDARGKVHFTAGKLMRDIAEAALSRRLLHGAGRDTDGDPLIVLVDALLEEAGHQGSDDEAQVEPKTESGPYAGLAVE